MEEKKVKVQKWVLKEIIESSSEEISLLSSSLSAYCPTMSELLSNEFKVRLSDNIYRFFKTTKGMNFFNDFLHINLLSWNRARLYSSSERPSDLGQA